MAATSRNSSKSNYVAVRVSPCVCVCVWGGVCLFVRACSMSGVGAPKNLLLLLLLLLRSVAPCVCVCVWGGVCARVCVCVCVCTCVCVCVCMCVCVCVGFVGGVALC